MTWKLIYTKQAQKDAKKLANSNLKNKTQHLLDILKKNPYQNPPSYEKLTGDLTGAYSRRSRFLATIEKLNPFHLKDFHSSFSEI